MQTYPGIHAVARLISKARTCQVNMVQECSTIVKRQPLVVIKVVNSSAMIKSDKRLGLHHIKKVRLRLAPIFSHILPVTANLLLISIGHCKILVAYKPYMNVEPISSRSLLHRVVIFG